MNKKNVGIRHTKPQLNLFVCHAIFLVDLYINYLTFTSKLVSQKL